MQHTNKNKLNINSMCKVNPGDHLELEKDLRIHLKILKPQENKQPPSQLSQKISSLAELSEPTKQLSTLVFGKTSPREKSYFIFLSGQIEIEKEIERPYFMVRDGNKLKLYLKDLSKNGIRLLSLTVTIPEELKQILAPHAPPQVDLHK